MRFPLRQCIIFAIVFAVLWLIWTSVADAQPAVPRPPVVPRVDAPDDYKTAYDLAVKQKKSLVVFVGIEVRKVTGAVSVQVESLNDSAKPRIIAGQPGKVGTWLDYDATDAEIRSAISGEKLAQPKGGSAVADPFVQREAQVVPSVEGDDGPWLSKAETTQVKAMWPKGVAWSDKIKFYRLAPVYQKLETSGGGSIKYNTVTEIHGHEEAKLTVSGGLSGVHGWRSIKGIEFSGPVKVWQENTEVRAYSQVPRWRWRFAEGTVAYDALFNDDGKAFEIRRQTKEGDAWQTSIIHKDEAARPAGYAGLTQTCASCHSRTAEVVSVPGRIYQRVRWGDDGRFSWRPFTKTAELDRRWPLEVVDGVKSSAQTGDSVYDGFDSQQFGGGSMRRGFRR